MESIAGLHFTAFFSFRLSALEELPAREGSLVLQAFSVDAWCLSHTFTRKPCDRDRNLEDQTAYRSIRAGNILAKLRCIELPIWGVTKKSINT